MRQGGEAHPNNFGELPMAKVRINMEVSEDLATLLDNLADQEDVTRTEIVRRGLSVLKAYRDQIASGRPHIGFTEDAKSLDAELIGVLTPPEPPKAKDTASTTVGYSSSNGRTA